MTLSEGSPASAIITQNSVNSMEERMRLTGRDIVVRFEGDFVGELNEVDGLQDSQTLANRGNTYFF